MSNLMTILEEASALAASGVNSDLVIREIQTAAEEFTKNLGSSSRGTKLTTVSAQAKKIGESLGEALQESKHPARSLTRCVDAIKTNVRSINQSCLAYLKGIETIV